MTGFPTSKIELHQWANSILLGIVGFFVVQTYFTIQKDHDKIGEHTTELAVTKNDIVDLKTKCNYLIGYTQTLSEVKQSKK
jgi:hypothetical protein